MANVLKSIVLRLKHDIIRGAVIRTGGLTITLDTSLIISIPVVLWATATIYVPVMGARLNNIQAWGISVIILIFMLVSMFLHSLAHIITAKAGGGTPDKNIYLSPLGDPAQARTAAVNAGGEFLTALAGPLTQALLAALFYLLWNLQINTYISVTAFFLVFFNLGLMAFNLIPAFPFDGGRIVRAISWRILGRPGLATKTALYGGWVIAGGVLAWSIALAVQKSRYSLETAGVTFFLCVLMIVSLLIHKRWKWNKPEQVSRRSTAAMTARACLAGLLVLPLLAVTFCLVPLNQGLEAPGFTASVETMIELPQEYNHTSSGSLILTTVIPQAPILAGEWAYAHFDNSIRLVPPEQVVPEEKTAQSVSQENFKMLLDSETTAIIVGLRLAGYPAEVKNEGVRVISILPASQANTILQPDDIITGINGIPVSSPSDLTGQLKLLTRQTVLDLKIQRNKQAMNLSVPTMEPSQEDGSVKIGITIEQYAEGYVLPFPVTIEAEKVNGGPSAGLMFTLGVYDRLTEEDLTGGRKIAGTGTIDLDGNVGPIGGVQQKVAAAERAGAQYFLTPVENYEDAAAAAKHITVIKIATANDAIVFLLSLPTETTK